MAHTITSIVAREVLDSMGNPTVQVTTTADTGQTARSIVPSGTSTGVHEAFEMRDGDPKRFEGRGVLKACRNVNESIAPKLIGSDVVNQKKLDEALILLDGTKNKTKLGANATLGVSLSAARLGSRVSSVPLYQYLRTVYGLNKGTPKLPTPLFNIFNGGKHADTNLDVQELMVVPVSPTTFAEKLRAGAEIFHKLKQVLLAQGLDTDVGAEGGFAPDIESSDQAMEFIMTAIQRAGYQSGRDIKLAIDVGASTFFNEDKKYIVRVDNVILNAAGLTAHYERWLERFPLMLIEDGMAEDDWDGWKVLTGRLGKRLVLVGDDLFVTNIERLKKGLKLKVANAIIIKPNQVGTLSETVGTAKLAVDRGLDLVISHRSGDTPDPFIADLSVALNARFIKAGSVSRGERVAKYNRLLEIEDELQNSA